jgi:transcription elongation GreA/GreB family factor
MARLDKREIVEKVRAVLAKEIDVLRQSAAAAREGATHEQAKPESDKDTRAIEASYLAGAQAGRLRVLEAADKRLEFLDLRDFKPADPIAPGALVEVDVDGKRSHYFVADAAGGTKVELGGVEVAVLTPEAPLAQSLLGKKTGESFERTVRGEALEYEIVSVS